MFRCDLDMTLLRPQTKPSAPNHSFHRSSPWKAFFFFVTIGAEKKGLVERHTTSNQT